MKIPPGLSLGKVIGAKGAGFKPLSAITECSVKVLPEERAVSCLQLTIIINMTLQSIIICMHVFSQVMIVTTDKAKLPLLVKTFETLHKDSEVSDRVTCTHKDYKNNVFDRGLQNSDGPSQWYIHPSGIDRHSSYWLSHYQTAKCGDKISYYELDSDVQVIMRSTMLLYFVCMCEVVYTHVYIYEM